MVGSTSQATDNSKTDGTLFPVWRQESQEIMPLPSARWLRWLARPLRKLCWKVLGLPAALERNRNHSIRWLVLLDTLNQRGKGFLRPGTKDWDIFYCVVAQNEYRLPEQFAPEDIILDVGMHIGSFCLAAFLRGSRSVYGFEAERHNFAQARHALGNFAPHVRIAHKAVWRSDGVRAELRQPSYAGDNTGGGSLLWLTVGEPVEAVALDDVLREITADGRRVRLLKIDCEGSEYPILLTSRSLHLVDAICGEYHEVGSNLSEFARVGDIRCYTFPVLEECLRRNGFTVTQEPDSASEGHLGKFFATRR